MKTRSPSNIVYHTNYDVSDLPRPLATSMEDTYDLASGRGGYLCVGHPLLTYVDDLLTSRLAMGTWPLARRRGPHGAA